MVARVVDDRSCPGALHAVAAVDGLLARVRVPGGFVTKAGLEALAALCERDADGLLDITSRANVQVRGLTEATLARFGTGLEEAGLITSRAHERVRNVIASAFAGFDPHERIDVRSTVRAFDERLAAAPDLAALPAKFMIAIDGGGFGIDVARADLALVVTSDARFALCIGGCATELTAAPQDAAALLVAAARAALALASQTRGDGDRTWRLARIAGARATIVAQLCGERATLRSLVADSPTVARTATPALRREDVPCGVLAAHRADLANVVPSVPLGRLSAAQARGLARLASDVDAEVRLGTWRGVALVGVPRHALAAVVRGVARLGLALDDGDGYRGVAACAGRGCASTHADVRADAATFAERVVASGAPPRAAWTINVAGCDKRCAMRDGADVDLIARDGGYDLIVGGTLVAQRLAARDAIARAVDRRVRSSALEPVPQ
ncbi:MAG: precorrin-3B synthase [Vulcanimicrobiaceae bacterium]